MFSFDIHFFFHSISLSLSTVCPPGKYKHRSGDDKCQTCPDHSMAPYSGSSECRCNQNYYRALKDPKSMPCTRKSNDFFFKPHFHHKTQSMFLFFSLSLSSEPPSKPQNLTVNFVDQSTVVLSWNQPHNLGGRVDTAYRVVCDACNVGVTYNPSQVIDSKLERLG